MRYQYLFEYIHTYSQQLVLLMVQASTIVVAHHLVDRACRKKKRLHTNIKFATYTIHYTPYTIYIAYLTSDWLPSLP